MNANSAHQSGWRQVLQTPLSDLLHGRVTGPREPLERLDTGTLSAPLVDAIRSVTDQLQGYFRWRVARRLVKSCRMLVQEGCAEQQLVEQLSEPASIAALIRATRRTDWIFNAPLPARLWPVVERIVVNPRVKRWSARRMLRRVCQNLRWQLDAGQAPEEIVSHCGDAVALSGLVYATDTVGELLEYPLPERLMSVVLEVVQRSKLWPGEKRDVALELCTHFADGLQKGESEAALLESFGDVRTTAKLIRRARLRNRSFAWRARRRTWQGLLVACFLLLIPWAVVTVRLMVAQPTIKYDPVEELDQQSRTIPREERAWPLYLQGISSLSKVDQIKLNELRRTGNAVGPESKNWPEFKAYLKEHKPLIDTYVRAASRPALGFINRPRVNDFDEFRELNRPYEMNPPGSNGFEIYLPQAQPLNVDIIPLLTGSVHLAAEEDQAERCLELLLARINVADHDRQTGPWLVCQVGANGWAGRAAELATQVVERYPNLFNERQLKVLREHLSKMPIPPLNLDPSEDYLKHILQHMYTDDGNGNGRFTAAGFQVLKSLVESSGENRRLLLSTIPALVRQDQREPDRSEWIPFQIKSGFLALQIADRKELRRELLFLNHLFWEDITKGTPETEAAYQEEYQRLMDSPALRLKYLPALMVMSPFQTSSYWTSNRSNRKPLTQKVVALTVIAVELYRREQGRFPETLQALVPDYFAEVPKDPGTGAPLRYQIRDGRPVVEAESLSVNKTN